MVSTTLIQSKRLLELGIDPNTADMYWWYAEGKDYLYVGKSDDSNGTPAWSLTALLNLMPKQQDIDIDISFGGYTFDGELVNKWFISFETGSISHVVNSCNLVDAAVEMIEWLYNNGYLGKEAEK